MLKIEAERRKRGWNQLELAYHARCQVSDISRYESARMRPYDSHAKRIAKVLGLRPDELQQPVEQKQ